MLNVLLDISALGAGYYQSKGRTGVFRAVQCLTSHLLRNAECTVNLTATESLVLLAKTRQYLADPRHLTRATFIEPENPLLHNMANGLERLISSRSGLATLGTRLLDRIARLLPGNMAAPSRRQLHPYDIVHATFYPLPTRWKQAQAPCRFQTVYDLIPLILPQFSTASLRSITQRSIDGIRADEWVLAISQATKLDLCEYTGLDPQRVFVTHLAASELFYQCTDADKINDAKKRYGIPEAPYILSLCTLEPRKNIPHVIRCFADLVNQERISDLHLILVGAAGWGYQEIFRQIKQYEQLQDRIIITGYVDDLDLAPLYSGALMFVYPSLYEGFGLPPLEAMQCGLPVITSNTSSLPEVVGDAGFMVSPQDADALCQAILEVYRQPTYALRLSERALARAGLFSWERSTQETIAAYKMAKSIC